MLISVKGLRAFCLFLGTSTTAFAASLEQFKAVSLPLQDIFDNQAASVDGSANFDGHGGSFDSSLLPAGPFTYDGVQVRLYSIFNKWTINR